MAEEERGLQDAWEGLRWLVAGSAHELAAFADQMLQDDPSAESGWILEFWDWVLEVEDYGYLQQSTGQFFRTAQELECYGSVRAVLNEVEIQAGEGNALLRVSKATARELRGLSMNLCEMLSA